MTSPSPRLFRPIASVFVFSLLLLGLPALPPLAAQSTDGPVRNFDIPADSADKTLRLFSSQSGLQIVFPSPVVAGVQTNAVKGDLAVHRALDLLLSGTPLVAVTEGKQGALTIRRASGAEKLEKNGESRRASDATAAVSTVESGVRLDRYEVVSSRVDGLINKGLLQGGAEAPLYHSVVDREEIERLGVTSIEELFRLIPQTSSAVTSLQGADGSNTTGGGLTSRFSTTSLRGFASGQTVILINGRALPRSARSSGGPDLNRIPLAAIQRIEIMPYAGSAVYGAGAIGGAINVILRKDYSGQDVTAYLGTSTEGGGTEYRLTFLDGRTFNGGKSNLTLTFSHQHRDPITAGQRDFIQELAGRFPVGSSNFFTYTLPALSSAPGVIYTSNAAGLGIPGAGTVRFATIPHGTTASQAFTLTPESFVATAGQLAPTQRAGRVVLYTPQDSYNVNAQIEHKFIEDKLEAYAELTYGYTRMNYAFPQSSNVSLSATDPINPFRTGVTPGFTGRSVVVYFDPVDLPPSDVVYEYETMRAVLGLKGKLSPLWEWSVDGTIDRSDATVRSNNPTEVATILNGLTVSSSTPGPAAAAATRRLVYPLLADHTAFPVSASDVATYYASYRNSYSHGRQYEFNARLTGDLFSLPAGWLKSSAFGKFRNFNLDSGQYYDGSAAFALLAHNGPFPARPSGSISDRDTWQGAMELAVPVISQSWRPIPVNEFTLNLSAGYERNITNGSDSFYNTIFKELTGSAQTYVAAAKLQIVPDLALRASFSDALAMPDWDQTGTPPTVFNSFGFLVDPKRGNTIQTEMFQSIFGGSPDLKPETAESRNVGLIFKPRFVKGLTLTVDWWNIEKENAIVSPVAELMMARPQDYPGRVVRAAPTAQDIARGWEGILTTLDTSYINVGQVRTDGVDSRIQYRWETPSAGTFLFTSNATFTNHFRSQQAPATPWIEMAGTQGSPVRWRGYGTVTWMKSAFSAGLTARYVGHYFTSTTAPSDPYPNATGIDGGRIPAFMRYDLQFGYEFAHRPNQRGWRNWVGSTKWTLGILNFLNERPTFVTNSGSFYNRYDDIRQRYLYVQVRKSL